MPSTFFPINETTFIDDCMEHITDINDWTSEYHTYIDEKVSYNGTDDNIMIINKYAGGVFEAIKIYKDEYGDIDTNCKHTFYAQLAYVSLYKKFYDEILDKINDTDDEERDDTNDDTDYETDDTVVKKTEYDTNVKDI